MFTFIVENKRGDQITLSGNRDYDIVDIQGLTSLNATINTSNTGLKDGGVFNSARTEMRNIVITVRINHPVEANRINLYNFFKIKQYSRIYYRNKKRNVYIEGYVETVENDLFENGQRMQISIICPQPYWSALATIHSDVSKVVRSFSFPFAIEKEGVEFSYIQKDYLATVTNVGDVDCGIVINITATGDVVNPIIYCSETGGSFGVKVSMVRSDQLIISTIDGDKYVKFIHNGVEVSYLNKIMKNPEWFVLSAGDNMFSYDAEEGVEYMSIYFAHKSLYQGV